MLAEEIKINLFKDATVFNSCVISPEAESVKEYSWPGDGDLLNQFECFQP